MKLRFEKFVDAEVGLVALVEEIDDDHVVFLAVTVAAADALLDALRVPRQVEVDDEGAELEVDALGRGLGGDEDFRRIPEGVDERGAGIHRAGSGHAAGVAIRGGPALEDLFGIRIVVGAVEEDDLAGVAVGFEELLEKGLGAARLGEDDGLARRGWVHRGHLPEADVERLEERAGLGVHADAAGPADVVVEFGDFFFELGGIDWLRSGLGGGSFLVGRDFRVLGIFQQFIEQLAVEIVARDELVEEAGAVFKVFLDAQEAVAHHFQSPGKGAGRGGEDFSNQQNNEVALALRESVAVVALEVAGDGFVKRVFLFAGAERLGQEFAPGVFHILQHLAAERAVTESGEPLAEGCEVAPGIGKLGAEGREIAEEALVDQRGESVKLDKRVLERRGGEEDFPAVAGRVEDCLAEAVALAVAVPELVGLVHDDEIPGEGLDFRRHPRGVVVGANDDLRLLEGRGVAGFLEIPVGMGVEDDGGQVELFVEFERPLLPKRSRGDDKQAASAFRPRLAEDEARLDGLAETDLIREQDSLRERRAQGEKRGFNLVGIEGDGGVEERPAQAIHAVPADPAEFVGVVFRVVGGH